VPRGSLHLAGAVISPSEEDSHTFVAQSASGDVYKMRATNAKERQEWITRLRVVAELHSQALAQVWQKKFTVCQSANLDIQYFYLLSTFFVQTNNPLVSREHGSSTGRVVPTNLSILDAFAQVQDWLQRAEHGSQELGHSIDKFPLSGVKLGFHLGLAFIVIVLLVHSCNVCLYDQTVGVGNTRCRVLS